MKSKIINLSVLLPTYNRPNMVEQCLSNIAKQNYLPRETIILDQGHLDENLIKEWAQVLLPTKLVYKHLNIRGRSRAINAGVKIAKSEFMGVIDDDCYAHPKWIESLAKSIQKRNKTIVTGKVAVGKQEGGAVKVRDCVLEELPKIYKRGKFIIPIFVLSGGNCCFRKKDFNNIGKFNTLLGVGAKFKSAEDVEWAYRALSKGYAIYYDHQAIVTHRSWRNESEDIKTMNNYGYGAGAFVSLIFPRDRVNSLYYGSKIVKWLFWEIFKSLITLKNPKPFIKYLSGFIAGLFDMKKIRAKNSSSPKKQN